MTPEEIEAIERRVANTTEGPWAWSPTGEKSNDWCVGTICDKNDKPIAGDCDFGQHPDAIVVDHIATSGSVERLGDAAFIAHARQDVPALLKELKAKDLQIDGLKKERADFQNRAINLDIELGNANRLIGEVREFVLNVRDEAEAAAKTIKMEPEVKEWYEARRVLARDLLGKLNATEKRKDESHTITLSESDFKRLVEILEAPVELTPALRKLIDESK